MSSRAPSAASCATNSRVLTVIGFQSEDRQYFWQRLARALADLLSIQTADGMRDHRVAIVSKTLSPGHRVAGAAKRIGQDRRDLHTLALEHRPVGHTGRTARPSITDTGQDDVRVVHHLVDQLVR